MNREDSFYDLAPDMGQQEEFTEIEPTEKDFFYNSTLQEKWPEIVDLKWQNEIIMQYAPLTRYVASRLAMRLPSHISKDDLISSGIIGLIDAIHKFDPKKGLKFKTYAEFRVKGAMLDELRDLDWMPRKAREKRNLIEKTRGDLQRTLGRPAEQEEMARTLGLEMKKFHEMLDIAKPLSLLDVEEFWRLSPDDKYIPNRTLDENEKENALQVLDLFQTSNIVAQCIKEFPYGMQLLISLYFYEELTMKEISSFAGCSESRISQLLTEALREIRPKLAKRLGILNYTSIINVNRHRKHYSKKSLSSLPKTLIWNPEKPGDDDSREKEVPNRWKNFGRKIYVPDFILIGEPHTVDFEKPYIPMPPLKTRAEIFQKEDNSMDKNLPKITHLIGYYLANKLRAKKINETSELFNLSSLQFEKLSLKPQTVRSIVSKMLEAGYFFSDDEEATRELLSRYPLGKKKLQKPDIPAPHGSAAADPASAVSVAADPPADDPNSFKSNLSEIGSALDIMKRKDRLSFRVNFEGPEKRRYRVTIEEYSLPPAE
ncbi:MAG: FliA/WhiG family RNA polymerase sigma factor [Parcubacteria group bacterium]|jgi:RNA polymerase sigma factor for flagellar operon FliA